MPYRRAALLLLLACLLAACGRGGPETTRIEVQFRVPALTAPEGESALGLGSNLFINRGFAWRDGLLYVPRDRADGKPMPLLVWLHGGGGNAADAKPLFPAAERFGVVILSLDSRHNTWDGIDSPFGPDVRFMQRAMQHVADRITIDPARVALGGLSDGASYALALGRSNGEMFTHLVGVSPWRLKPPAPPRGKPRIFLAHGTRDTVYPEWHTRRFIEPGLRDAGYDVTYLPFDGPHWVTEFAAREIMRWLVGAAPAGALQPAPTP